MAGRDPCLDPQPGDVLIPQFKDAAQPPSDKNTPGLNDPPRTVTGRPPGLVAFKTDPLRPATHCLITTWQQWCERTAAKPKGD